MLVMTLSPKVAHKAIELNNKANLQNSSLMHINVLCTTAAVPLDKATVALVTLAQKTNIRT